MADHSWKGVLPRAMCPVSVIVKPRKGKAVSRNRVKFWKHVLTWLQMVTVNQNGHFHSLNVVGRRLQDRPTLEERLVKIVQ